jgi:hypothetical protein
MYCGQILKGEKVANNPKPPRRSGSKCHTTCLCSPTR